MSDLFDEAIHEIEKEIKVPEGFFKGLLNEDDWSFIIKIHALIEAVISFLLVKSLSKPKLKNVISFLELSNTRTGKLAFIKDLNLLKKKHRRFIKCLSEIRNSLTHNVSNVGINLDGFFNELNKQKRDEYINGICLENKDDIEIAGKKITYVNFVRENLKIGIWYACIDLFTEVYILKIEADVKEEYYNFAEGIANSIKKKNLKKLMIK